MELCLISALYMLHGMNRDNFYRTPDIFATSLEILTTQYHIKFRRKGVVMFVIAHSVPHGTELLRPLDLLVCFVVHTHVAEM